MTVRFGKVAFTRHSKILGFVDRLASGRLVASRCTGCGHTEFPPRADCPRCLGHTFEFVDRDGRGLLKTFTRIDAAPAGFEDLAPYTLGVVDLEAGGRLLAWIGESLAGVKLEVGMKVVAVPRSADDATGDYVFYTLERPGGES